MEYANRKIKVEKLEMIGKWSTRIRKRAGLSIIDIANATGYSRGTIYSYENGKVDSAYLLTTYMFIAFMLQDSGQWLTDMTHLLHAFGLNESTEKGANRVRLYEHDENG